MTTVRRRRLGRLAAAALTLALIGAGALTGQAAANASAAPHDWHVLVGAQSSDQAIQTMAYYPQHLSINQGDSVTWTADSAEIHTVTFFAKASPCPPSALCAPPPGFNPGDPRQSTPNGTANYDGTSYYNSGVMTSATGDTGPLPPFVVPQHHYTLHFPSTLPPGDYTYVCLVHGQRMQGTITVRPAGTAYPLSQRDYDRQARQAQRADVHDGYQLWARARHDAEKLNDEDGPTVLIGAMDDRAMVMRFIPSTLEVDVGGKVRFVSNAMDTPHTVTFGSDETGCGQTRCDPTAAWNVTRGADGNLAANYPGHNSGFTGDPANLSTGIMLGVPPSVTGLPAQLTLTITAAFSYDYTCALHDFMGMKGKLTVAQDDQD